MPLNKAIEYGGQISTKGRNIPLAKKVLENIIDNTWLKENCDGAIAGFSQHAKRSPVFGFEKAAPSNSFLDIILGYSKAKETACETVFERVMNTLTPDAWGNPFAAYSMGSTAPSLIMEKNNGKELVIVSNTGEATYFSAVPQLSENDICSTIKASRNISRKIKALEGKVEYFSTGNIIFGYGKNSPEKAKDEEMPMVADALLRIMEEDGCLKKMSESGLNPSQKSYLSERMADKNSLAGLLKFLGKRSYAGSDHIYEIRLKDYPILPL